ncbi:MAG: polynucleotide adenylyltransferase PcnB, partial [Deltaproteobacteria bacterium]|nr:polynucleotide adenylyltransferase PcnB [Deltaproteobacteria bacterium]
MSNENADPQSAPIRADAQPPVTPGAEPEPLELEADELDEVEDDGPEDSEPGAEVGGVDVADFGGLAEVAPGEVLTVGDTGERPPEVLVDEPAEPLPELEGKTESGEPAEINPALLDPDAVKVVHRLRSHGFEAYFVGGCVRDLLVGLKPKDFDVATSATPDEVRDIFRNCRLIGRRFRLAHVYFKGGKVIEVSTFRRSPGDALPDTVAPTVETAAELASEEGKAEDLLITTDNVFGTAEEDARRRDFTVNALFYDVGAGKVIDFVRGRRDLDRQLIRTIGDPEVRLREDPVRLIRGVRFASKLGFDIDPRTYAAMEGAVEELPRCAPPRLLEDTFRVLRGGISEPALKLLSALDALQVLLPPVDEFLKRGGPAVEQVFYAHARALDARFKAGGTFEDAMLLAVLLQPLCEGAPVDEGQGGEGRPQVAQAVEELLAQLVRTARLPRRIAERCRMLLFAQRTLSGKRRRRGSLASFRRHPLFLEALVVFEISVEATGQHAEALARWKEGGVPESAPGAPSPGGEGRGRRRRRRR